MKALPKLRGITAGVMLFFFVYGCTPRVETPNSPQEDLAGTLEYLLTKVASQATSPPTATTQPAEEVAVPPPAVQVGAPEDVESAIPAEEASGYYGSVILVRLDRADCSYRPNVNGEPTFCNDQPYPNHNFTLLVWGQDWSFLDGRCLLVEGEVVEYEGIPEIEAEDLSQVSYCGE